MALTGCQSCCSSPHGNLPVLAFFLVLAAQIFGWFSMWSCNYVEREDGFKFGLFIREYPSWAVNDDWKVDDWNYDDWRWNCRIWESDVMFDGKWNTARAMAGITQPMGFVILVFHFCLFCMAFPQGILTFVSFGMVLVSTMKFLELIALASDACRHPVLGYGDCGFSTGAGMSIASGVVWMIAACVMCMVKEVPNDDQAFSAGVPVGPVIAATVPGSIKPPAGTVTTTETVMPNGSVKITKTTINADGSKTVVETIQHHAEAEPEAETGAETDIEVPAMEDAKPH